MSNELLREARGLLARYCDAQPNMNDEWERRFRPMIRLIDAALSDRAGVVPEVTEAMIDAAIPVLGGGHINRAIVRDVFIAMCAAQTNAAAPQPSTDDLSPASLKDVDQGGSAEAAATKPIFIEYNEHLDRLAAAPLAPGLLRADEVVEQPSGCGVRSGWVDVGKHCDLVLQQRAAELRRLAGEDK